MPPLVFSISTYQITAAYGIIIRCSGIGTSLIGAGWDVIPIISYLPIMLFAILFG